MKANQILFLLLLAPTMIGCGSSQKSAYNDYEYQEWKRQQQQQQQQQRPSRTLRTVEPCIAMANAESENLRAYGTATSYVEKVALSEAERDARNRMASMIKVAVEGAAQDYAQNAARNMKSSAGTLGESIMTQYVAQEISNTRVIETSIYDLSDGSVQVYVCIEMRNTTKEFSDKLENELSRDGVIELEYDRERFMQKMSEGLERYKKENNLK